jgi:acetoacetate decarboxylase
MEDTMTEEDIRNRAFAMPFTNPAYPPDRTDS